jgi:polysaccharide biosynthesis transport protein
MLDKQITNNTNPYGKITPVSRSFPYSAFPPLEEGSNGGNFQDFFHFLRRRAIIIIGVVFTGMTVVTYTTLNQESIYQGNFQILVEAVNNDDKIGKLNLADSNITPNGLDYESQIQVLKSSELLQPVVKKLQASYPDITYNSLVSSLSLNRLGATKIIQVSYQSNNPQKIKFVLDTISQFYLNYSLNKRQTKLRQGVQFVDKQLPDIKNRVTQLQQEMQIFRQRYNFIDPENQAETVSKRVQSLTEQRLSVNLELTAARSNYLRLQTQEEQLAILNGAPLYQQLIGQQRQLDVEISGKLAQLQPDNPAIRTLQEKRDNLLSVINAEAKRILNIRMAEAAIGIRKVETTNQQLTQAEQQLQTKLEQLPVLSRQYIDIQRNLQLATDSLTRFLANREKLQIEVAQTELPWELIQAPSLLQYPISPNIYRNLLLGLMASSLVALGAARITEELDNTYHNIDSIKDRIGLPVLGNLPFDKFLLAPSLNASNMVSDETIVTTDVPQDINQPSQVLRRTSPNRNYSQGEFWEAVQVLYSNIQLLNSDRPIKSLAISSSMAGDGKTTTAFNLAKVATAMGKRVLLVDTDLRRPSIHKMLQLNNLWGLSNLISLNMNLEEVIKEVPTINNLSVITSGPIPPDPARLLSSAKMKQLMDHFAQNFDLVIYDCSPFLGLVDARLVAPNTDGVMLVVRMNKTDKSALSQVMDSIQTYPINLLGIVVNADKSPAGYYKKYNYSYYKHLNEQEVSNN